MRVKDVVLRTAVRMRNAMGRLCGLRGLREKSAGVRKRGPSPQTQEDLSAALYLELTATMLGAGLSLSSALLNLGELNAGRYRAVCSAVVDRLTAGGSWEQAWDVGDVPPSLQPLRDTLGFMIETGAPTAALLEVMAARERRRAYREAEKAAAKLGVKLVVPLGLCSLPAFICLGVIPVLIAMVPATMP